MTIDEAIQKAIDHLKANRTVGTNARALQYLQNIGSATKSARPGYEEDAKRAQILYALATMSAWHGPEAREVKDTLKTYAAPGTGGMS